MEVERGGPVLYCSAAMGDDAASLEVALIRNVRDVGAGMT